MLKITIVEPEIAASIEIIIKKWTLQTALRECVAWTRAKVSQKKGEVHNSKITAASSGTQLKLFLLLSSF